MNAHLVTTTAMTLFLAVLSFALMPPITAAMSVFLGVHMFLIARYDAKHFIIPDILSLPAALMGLAFAPFAHQLAFSYDALIHHTVAAFVSALLLLLVRQTYWLIKKREGLGLGDVKLALAAGAWAGYPGFTYTILVACLAAILFVMVKTSLYKQSMQAKTKIAFGAFFAPAIWLIWFVQSLPQLAF